MRLQWSKRPPVLLRPPKKLDHTLLSRSRESDRVQSQYGSITRSANYFDLGPALQQKMQATLEEIRSGAFAREWSTDREGKLALIGKAREAQRTLPMTQWEDSARRAFRIGNAAPGKR